MKTDPKCVCNRIKINVFIAFAHWEERRKKRDEERNATSACATAEIRFSICVIHDARKSHLPIVINITTHCSERNLCVFFFSLSLNVSCLYVPIILSSWSFFNRAWPTLSACVALICCYFWLLDFRLYLFDLSPALIHINIFPRLVHIITATAFRHKSIATNKAKSADQHPSPLLMSQTIT